MPDSPCPYCGHVPESPDAARCGQCGGLFEPLSRKATQLAMGPWFVRDEARPFMPGFSEAILRHQVASGRVKPDTIVRGPSTHQFWQRADQTPGLSRLLGKCHACAGAVATDAQQCNACHADLSMPNDLDRLGLAYVEPADRQQAQADVDAQRTAPPPKPKPAPKQAPAIVSSDLLEPVAPAQEPEPQAAVQPVYEPEPAAAIAEDLWQSDAPVATRRRRRKSGPDPMVLGLGVLLLMVVGIGLFIMVADRGDAGDPDNPSANTSQPVERTEDQVASIGGPAQSRYEELRKQEVPAQFQQTLDRAGKLIEQGERNQKSGKHTRAYDAFAEADELLKPLPEAIAQYEADQAARAEVTALLDEVSRLQAQGEAAQAGQYAAAFSQGTLQAGEAAALFEKGDYADALAKAEEAKGSFEKAVETAQAAADALAAKKALVAAMENSASEKTLRQHAANDVDRLNTLRQSGNDKFNSRDYADSKRAFDGALASLRDAEQAMELAKYRKVYAYRAGHQAAGVLLAIAAGDGIDDAARTELKGVFDQLRLSDNPASDLKAGEDADYAQAAQALVTAARGALTETHGEAVQACYHAGFQIRIIEQSLATPSLTKDQQQRIHQSLSIFQEQAASGGWDILKLRSVVETVRAANRNAALGKPPEQTRTVFEVLVKPLQQRESAARLMDPALSPSTPQDPELFPGLGVRRP